MDQGAREVQGVAGQVHDGLDHVGVGEVRWVHDPVHGGGHGQLRVVQERLDDFVDHPGTHERFVALDVDHHLHVQAAHHFGHAVRAGVVLPRSKHRQSAEAATAAMIRSSSVATISFSRVLDRAAFSYTCRSWACPRYLEAACRAGAWRRSAPG